MSDFSSRSKVNVVMATYNGAGYIVEQMTSIMSQRDVDVSLTIYDDCSTDGTVAVVREYIETVCSDAERPLIRLIVGEQNIGFPGSFFAGLDGAPNNVDFYAFADQDDVWLLDKLSDSLSALDGRLDADTPILYTEPTTCVNEELDFLYERSLDSLRISVSSFFLRARCAAHTMVFNRALRDHLLAFSSRHYGFSHGYLALILSIATGGSLVVGNRSHTLHRRLGSSVSDGGKGIGNRVRAEINNLLRPNINRSALARELLEYKPELLGEQDRTFLETCASYRGSVRSHLRLLNPVYFRCGVAGVNVEMWAAALVGRF